MGICRRSRFFLEFAADIEARDDDWGMSPLMLACDCEDMEMIRLILENGANPIALIWLFLPSILSE